MNPRLMLAAVFVLAGSLSHAQMRGVAPRLQTGGSLPSAAFGSIQASRAGTITGVPSLSLPAAGLPAVGAPSLGVESGLAAPAVPTISPEAPAALEPASPSEVPSGPALQATLGQLRDIADMLFAPSGERRAAPSSPDSGRAFDGKERLSDSVEGPEAVEEETVTREVADPGQETMDLWMTGKGIKKPVVKSQIYGSMRTVRGKPSLRYWQKFVKGTPVRILLGNSTLFVSRVERSQVKKIKALTRNDLEGILPASFLRGKTIARIRKAVIADLRAREVRAAMYSGRGGAIITPETEVSLVSFIPYAKAASLPENSDGPAAEPRPRTPVSVPEALAFSSRFLPKVVFLDLRGVRGPLSYDVIEDIGKLMKAGVYFVLLGEKPVQGPGSIEGQLTGALTARQRDGVTRYKMFSLGLDGNEFAKYEGRFPKSLPFTRFEGKDIDVMKHVAATLGGAVTQGFAKEVIVSLPKGADAAAFSRDFQAELRKFSVPSSGLSVTAGTSKGKPALFARPHSLETAFPVLLEALREDENLYVNASDIMVVSRDQAILRALPGSVKPSEHVPASGDLLETSLAGMLGPYRENVPGDFAASASKIGSFKKGYLGGGGDGGNIYMFMGHVMHSAFNWAVWSYRNSGAFPTADALVAKALHIWANEDAQRTKNLIRDSNQSMADHQATMELRMRTMHAVVADVLKTYPIAIGTELPNLHVFERFKKGNIVARDILRMVYDFVVARETPDGIELMIVDFKTGQTKSNQTFDKDVQVQLYDLIPRLVWSTLPVPYGVTGTMKKVVKVGVLFVYPPEMKEARLTEWTRLKYEKFLRSIMNRMRKAAQPFTAKDKKTK